MALLKSKKDSRGEPAEKKNAKKSPAADRNIAPETEPLNQEQQRLRDWYKTVKFKKTAFGGIDEVNLWKKLEELNEIYESSLSAERARYDALIKSYNASARKMVAQYKAALDQANADYDELNTLYVELQSKSR